MVRKEDEVLNKEEIQELLERCWEQIKEEANRIYRNEIITGGLRDAMKLETKGIDRG